LKRRELVLEKLGGKCAVCGTTKRLHLHHIYYSKDSARWVEGKHDPYNQREKEAYEHPERFKLLCVTCHGNYHQGSLRRKLKRLALVTCKICNWVYFPNEIKKHEENCSAY